MRERVSPEGYSVTADEKRYLQCLCAGPRDAHKIADELAADPSVIEQHRPETVADQLVYLVDYGGTAHLVAQDGDRYRLTENGQAILC